MTDTTTQPEVVAHTSGDPVAQPHPEGTAPQPEPPAQNGESQPTKRERKGPGRPRVAEVVARDNMVFDYLQANGPLQVRIIAESTGITKNAAYLSLWRLRREGRVEFARDGKNRMWSAVS